MTDDFERRIRDAVAAEGAGVQPDDASLATIRHRVAMSKRRRLVGGTALGAAAALVIGIAIGVAAGGDDTTDVAVGGGSTTTTEPCPSTTVPATATTGPPSSFEASTTTSIVSDDGSTTIPVTTVPPVAAGNEEEITHESEEIARANCGAPTTGTVPTTGTSTPNTEPSTTTTLPAEPEAVVFPVGLPLPPDQAPPVEWRTPEGIAQAYLDHLGVKGAELAAYDSLRKQIVVYRPPVGGSGEALARTVLTIVPAKPVCDAQGTCHEYWVVTQARSTAIVVDTAEVQPPADAQGHWTLALEGRARGFEGNVVVRVVGTGDVAWSAEGVITAGCCEQPEPFSTFVDLGQPPIGGATVLLANESGEDGSPWELTAFPIEIAIP